MRLLMWLLGGCVGGFQRFADLPPATPTAETGTEPALVSTAGVFDVAITVETNDCAEPDVAEVFAEQELKFDQAAQGLSVFIDPDMGWIPCDGPIEGFNCRWGNAPSGAPGTWTWSLYGMADGSTIVATLALTVTCDGAPGCADCSAVGRIEGDLR